MTQNSSTFSRIWVWTPPGPPSFLLQHTEESTIEVYTKTLKSVNAKV